MTDAMVGMPYRLGLKTPDGPCELCGRLSRASDSGGCRADVHRKYHIGLLVDHCHKHNVIRGTICGSCNNKMRGVDKICLLNPDPMANMFGRLYVTRRGRLMVRPIEGGNRQYRYDLFEYQWKRKRLFSYWARCQHCAAARRKVNSLLPPTTTND